MSRYGKVSSGRDDPVPSAPMQNSPGMTSPVHVGYTDEVISNEPETDFTCRDDPVPSAPMQNSPGMTSPVHVGFTNEVISNEPETYFTCPEFHYDVRRLGRECSLDDTATILVNKSTADRLPWSGAYRIRGTRGSEALTQSSYWEVHVTAEAREGFVNNKAWCEVGVAGEAAMRAFPRDGWIGDCSSHAAATVSLSKRNTQVGVGARCQGRFLGIVAVAEFHRELNQVLLGMLWDAPRRRLSFIDVTTAEVMFDVALQGTEPLHYVCATYPVDWCGAEVKVELVTGGRVQMTDEKRSLIRRLLLQES